VREKSSPRLAVGRVGELQVDGASALCLVSRGYWLDGGGSEDNATECMQYLFRYMPRRDMQVLHCGTRPTVTQPQCLPSPLSARTSLGVLVPFVPPTSCCSVSPSPSSSSSSRTCALRSERGPGPALWAWTGQRSWRRSCPTASSTRTATWSSGGVTRTHQST
jgi:hypothetical protein